MRILGGKAKSDPKRIVFAEADNQKILKAAQIAFDERLAYPILLGDEKKIRSIALTNNIDIDGMPIIDPRSDEYEEKRKQYGELFFKKRQRKGINAYESFKIMKDRNYFGCMMVETGDADGVISGLTRNYAEAIRPALQVIGTEEDVKKIAGMYLLLTKRGPLFLADTTVNFNPTAEELAEITLMVAKEVRNFNLTPRIAMLSYANFGSSNSPEHPPACCTQQTITVPPQTCAKTAQKHDYPSKQHRQSYARRTGAERTFSTAKDPASNNIARGWTRLMGLAPLMLWLTCLLAVRNQRILDAWTARQDDNARRAAAGLPPRTRRRRRKTLTDLATAGTPP